MTETIVIIPVFGRQDVFTTVEFLRRQSYAADLRFIIVDNGNTKELSSRLATLKGDDCEIVRLERNLGGSGAFRAGMMATLAHDDSRFVWLLDDDALVNEFTLPGLQEEWNRLVAAGDRPGAIGSAMLGRLEKEKIIEVGSRISRLTSKMRPYFHGMTLESVGQRTDRVEYVAAASLITSTDILRRIGIFEDVFIHFDDIDWCFRVAKAGYGVYATTRSYVNHMEGKAKAANWVIYYNYRNRLWFLKRHLPFLHKVVVVEMLAALILAWLMNMREKATLVRLGIRHSMSGELLMRDELPANSQRRGACRAPSTRYG